MDHSQKLIQKAISGKQNLLEPEAYEILKEYAIPLLEYRFVKSERDAVAAAAELGFPIAMKVVSKDVIHKSESGGVKLNLADKESVAEAFRAICSEVPKLVKEAQIAGVLLTPMCSGGLEMIVGMTRDPQFGPAIMVGLGGLFVEVMKDIVLQVAPLSRDEARAMIREMKAYPLLAGTRGRPPYDQEALVRILMNVAKLSEDFSEIAEIDLNPVMVLRQGAYILDARILLSAKG